MPPPSEADTFLKHVLVEDAKYIIDKDGQKEGILLPQKQLQFVLLFYTLCLWDQAESATPQLFLKIPRKEHLNDPAPEKRKNREKNVNAFRDKCRELLAKYENELSEEQRAQLRLAAEQKEGLDPKTHAHLLDFSTFFSMDEKGAPWLHIHYRGGKDMYREEAFKHSADKDYKTIRQIDKAKIDLNDANYEFALVHQKIAAANALLRRPPISRWRNLFSLGRAGRRRAAENRQLRTELDELENSLKDSGSAFQKKQMAIARLQELKTEPGGVLATGYGGEGVGRLQQCFSVRLPPARQPLKEFNFTAPDNLFIEKSPFESAITPPQDLNPGTGEMILHMGGFIFCKSGQNSAYQNFQDNLTTMRKSMPQRLKEVQTSFQAEVKISNESGRAAYYLVNPITEKPRILQQFCIGKNLEELKNDVFFSLKHRLMLSYLILKAYEKFSSYKGEKFCHCDLKEANILVQRTSDNIEIIFVDRSFTAKLNAEGKAIVERKNYQLGGTYATVQVERGTRGYIAPEIAQGEKKIYSQASDIFALGVTFHKFIFKGPDTGLAPQQSTSISALSAFCKNTMQASEAGRATLGDTLEIFQKTLAVFGISDPDRMEDLGQFFADYLPDKAYASHKVRPC